MTSTEQRQSPPDEPPDEPSPVGRCRPFPSVPRIGPAAALVPVLVWLAAAWGAVFAVDVAGVGGSNTWLAQRLPESREAMLWMHLFNDRPTEWLQWLVMALTAGTAAHLGGRLRAGEVPLLPRAGRFWTLLGFGVAILMIEDTGDVRDVLSAYVHDLVDAEIFGLHFTFFVELPVFAALSVLPLYALVRHGRYAWRARPARPFLVAGYGLYAVAAIGSVLLRFGDFYANLGAWLRFTVMGGRLPEPRTFGEDWMHIQLVDSILEETIELLAVTCLLAAALAFARAVARDRVPPEPPRGPREPAAPTGAGSGPFGTPAGDT